MMATIIIDPSILSSYQFQNRDQRFIIVSPLSFYFLPLLRVMEPIPLSPYPPGFEPVFPDWYDDDWDEEDD